MPDFVLEKIHEINGEVENVKYIRLIKKHNTEDTFPPYIDYIMNTT